MYSMIVPIGSAISCEVLSPLSATNIPCGMLLDPCSRTCSMLLLFLRTSLLISGWREGLAEDGCTINICDQMACWVSLLVTNSLPGFSVNAASLILNIKSGMKALTPTTYCICLLQQGVSWSYFLP